MHKLQEILLIDFYFSCCTFLYFCFVLNSYHIHKASAIVIFVVTNQKVNGKIVYTHIHGKDFAVCLYRKL